MTGRPNHTPTSPVQDARPPLLLVRALNPVMRLVLRTPVGRLVRPFALLEFSGCRSGRRYRVPVGWHLAGDEHVVLTPAPWRANFSGGADVVVSHRGRQVPMRGLLHTDPEVVAAAVRSVCASGGTPARIGIRAPVGHVLTADDMVEVDRALIRFEPVS